MEDLGIEDQLFNRILDNIWLAWVNRVFPPVTVSSGDESQARILNPGEHK